MPDMLIVKCQQNRGRNVTDANGTKEYNRNALCLHILGRIADIDGRQMRLSIENVLNTVVSKPEDMARTTEALMKLFRESFVASYWCPSCHAFMDLGFTDPGYEARAVFSKDVDYGRTVNPVAKSRQMEL